MNRRCTRRRRRRFLNSYWEPLAVWKATPKRTSIEWAWLPSLTAPQVNLSIAYESGVEFQMEFAVEVSFLGPRKFWWFHIVILQRTAKKCTQFENARAELLFCSLDLLFYHVPSPSWFAKGPYYLNCTPFEHKVPHVQETENITYLTIKPSCLQGTMSTCLRTWISRERKHQTLRFITWNGRLWRQKRRNKLTGINHVSSRKLQFCRRGNRRKQTFNFVILIFIIILYATGGQTKLTLKFRVKQPTKI